MKILHLITSLKVGGAESALVNLLTKVVNKDGNIHVVAYFHPGLNVKKIEALGVKGYHLSGIFSIYDPILIFRLIKLIKAVKPDLIHSSLWSANIVARIIAKIYKIPVVCDLHGNSFDEGKFRNWFDRKTVHLCDKIVAVSDSVKTAYLKNIIGAIRQKELRECAKSKLSVIRNGIDIGSLASALNNPLNKEDFGLSNCFVVGAVGRLEPIKSYDILIKAFAKFLSRNSGARAKLCIVGDGSQKTLLQNLAISLKIEAYVIFVGFRPDAYKFYPLFDCFALSSQSEGLSIALLEAMASGLPVISTHSDLNYHDVIKHGINGFLVLSKDSEGYADAINKFYQNLNYAKAVGQCNKELVESDFNIDKMIAEYQTAYRDAFAARRNLKF